VCRKYGRACVFDKFSDKRTKTFVKKAQEQLKHCQEFLDQVLDAIRFGSLVDVQGLITMIRSGSSVEELKIFFANCSATGVQSMEFASRKRLRSDSTSVHPKKAPRGSRASGKPHGGGPDYRDTIRLSTIVRQ
jgi:hypothetical protein